MNTLNLVVLLSTLFFGIQVCIGQISNNDQTSLTVLFSAHTSPEKLNQMVEELRTEGIEFKIHDLQWKNDNELTNIHFEVRERSGKRIFGPELFQYNNLTRSSVFFIYQSGNSYKFLSSDAGIVQQELWDMAISKIEHEDILIVSSFYDPINTDKATRPARLFDHLNDQFQETLTLLSQIRADRDPANRFPNFHYYYNNQRVSDSFYLPIMDMAATVELKADSESYPSIYLQAASPIPA